MRVCVCVCVCVCVYTSLTAGIGTCEQILIREHILYRQYLANNLKRAINIHDFFHFLHHRAIDIYDLFHFHLYMCVRVCVIALLLHFHLDHLVDKFCLIRNTLGTH
jgi:hypothetical protein